MRNTLRFSCPVALVLVGRLLTVLLCNGARYIAALPRRVAALYPSQEPSSIDVCCLMWDVLRGVCLFTC